MGGGYMFDHVIVWMVAKPKTETKFPFQLYRPVVVSAYHVVGFTHFSMSVYFDAM